MCSPAVTPTQAHFWAKRGSKGLSWVKGSLQAQFREGPAAARLSGYSVVKRSKADFLAPIHSGDHLDYFRTADHSSRIAHPVCSVQVGCVHSTEPRSLDVARPCHGQSGIHMGGYSRDAKISYIPRRVDQFQ